MDGKKPENDQRAAIHILIVEDSAIQAEALRRVLSTEGYIVSAAKDGAAGLAKAKDLSPDLVITDIMMPEMDGFELCRNIKAEERLRRIPVILLTSLSDPQDVMRGLVCEADNFVIKPYEANHLLSVIQDLLHGENPHDREENQPGIHFSYRGEKYCVTSNRTQIINLLISTYETALARNLELIQSQDDLKILNRDLDEMVKKRTAALQAKNNELNTVLQQLWQAAKLATMGELASSIAHELNNPLATVSLRMESLTAQTPETDPRRRELEIVGQEVERMGNLVTNLLQFSRRSQPQISTVDVREEIEKTFELIEYHLRKNNVKVIREFAADVPCIHADRQQLRQLFLNLFTNASDAMPRGGTLTLRVTALPDERQILIEIVDTGEGIPPEILPKVMEPFYTTKPEGKGTGLGLAICRRIAEGHGGSLNIVSEGVPGKGTRVCITLSFSNGSNSAGLMDD